MKPPRLFILALLAFTLTASAAPFDTSDTWPIAPGPTLYHAVLTDPAPAAATPAPSVVVVPVPVQQEPPLSAQQQAVLQNALGWLTVAKALSLPFLAFAGWAFSELRNMKARQDRQSQQNVAIQQSQTAIALATPAPPAPSVPTGPTGIVPLLIAGTALLLFSGCGTVDSVSAGGTVTTDGNQVTGGGGEVTVHLRQPGGYAK